MYELETAHQQTEIDSPVRAGPDFGLDGVLGVQAEVEPFVQTQTRRPASHDVGRQQLPTQHALFWGEGWREEIRKMVRAAWGYAIVGFKAMGLCYSGF